MKLGTVLRVTAGSLGDELGLVPGDKIVSVNGQALRDIIDLSFAMAEEEIDLLVEHVDGEQEMYSFDKDFDEELGVEFTSAVFDGIRSCGNHCLFCFVDQVAPDMRESLYVKDDDYRLSFLYGNFITMTNMGDADFKRIASYHLSPLFVSVHTTDMPLRAKMLGTPKAAELINQLDRLNAAGADYHAQVVLCPGLNDGKMLDKTIEKEYNAKLIELGEKTTEAEERVDPPLLTVAVTSSPDIVPSCNVMLKLRKAVCWERLNERAA